MMGEQVSCGAQGVGKGSGATGDSVWLCCSASCSVEKGRAEEDAYHATVNIPAVHSIEYFPFRGGNHSV